MRTDVVRPVGQSDETTVSQTNLKPWMVLACLLCAGAVTTALLKHYRVISKPPLGVHVAVAVASGLIASGLGYRSWRRREVPQINGDADRERDRGIVTISPQPTHRPQESMTDTAITQVRSTLEPLGTMGWVTRNVLSDDQLRANLETAVVANVRPDEAPTLKQALAELNRQCPYDAHKVAVDIARMLHVQRGLVRADINYQAPDDELCRQLLRVALREPVEDDRYPVVTARRAVRFLVEANPALGPRLTTAQGKGTYLDWLEGLRRLGVLPAATQPSQSVVLDQRPSQASGESSLGVSRPLTASTPAPTKSPFAAAVEHMQTMVSWLDYVDHDIWKANSPRALRDALEDELADALRAGRQTRLPTVLEYLNTQFPYKGTEMGCARAVARQVAAIGGKAALDPDAKEEVLFDSLLVRATSDWGFAAQWGLSDQQTGQMVTLSRQALRHIVRAHPDWHTKLSEAVHGSSYSYTVWLDDLAALKLIPQQR